MFESDQSGLGSESYHVIEWMKRYCLHNQLPLLNISESRVITPGPKILLFISVKFVSSVGVPNVNNAVLTATNYKTSARRDAATDFHAIALL